MGPSLVAVPYMLHEEEKRNRLIPASRASRARLTLAL